MNINWSDPNSKISKYFTVKEALFLNSWNIYHIPSDEEKVNILKLAEKMDIIRERINKPINVHCWIRPIKVNCPTSKYNGQNYNKAIGSVSTKSTHITGKACDFHVVGFESAEKCKEIRALILPWLVELDMRMEDLDGSWIHVDIASVISNRFFKP